MWRVPSVDSVQLLAQYLGVTISELLREAPPEGQARAALTEYLAQDIKSRLSGEQKEPTPVDGDGQGRIIIKIAGRDGSFVERWLTRVKGCPATIRLLPSLSSSPAYCRTLIPRDRHSLPTLTGREQMPSSKMICQAISRAALTTLYWTWPAKARLPHPAGILSGYSVVRWIYFLSVRLCFHLIV